MTLSLSSEIMQSFCKALQCHIYSYEVDFAGLCSSRARPSSLTNEATRQWLEQLSNMLRNCWCKVGTMKPCWKNLWVFKTQSVIIPKHTRQDDSKNTGKIFSLLKAKWPPYSTSLEMTSPKGSRWCSIEKFPVAEWSGIRIVACQPMAVGSNPDVDSRFLYSWRLFSASVLSFDDVITTGERLQRLWCSRQIHVS